MSEGLEGFGHFTKFAIQVQLCLREDELNDLKEFPSCIQIKDTVTQKIISSTIKYNCLNFNTTIFNEKGEIEALGLQIAGKPDTGMPINFLLHRLDDCPALCALRHFLAWISMIGFNGGMFFPSKMEMREIVKKLDAGETEVYIEKGGSYAEYDSMIKRVCNNVCVGRDGPFTPHSGRSTGIGLKAAGGA